MAFPHSCLDAVFQLAEPNSRLKLRPYLIEINTLEVAMLDLCLERSSIFMLHGYVKFQ